MVARLNLGIPNGRYINHGHLDVCELENGRVTLLHQEVSIPFDPVHPSRGWGIKGAASVVLLAPISSGGYIHIQAINVLVLGKLQAPRISIQAQNFFALDAELIGDVDLHTENPPVFVGGSHKGVIFSDLERVVIPLQPQVNIVKTCFATAVKKQDGSCVALGFNLIDDAITELTRS